MEQEKMVVVWKYYLIRENGANKKCFSYIKLYYDICKYVCKQNKNELKLSSAMLN